MTKNKIYDIVLSGKKDNSIKFRDLRNLLLSMDFLERINGGHFIYKHANIPDRIVIQPLGSNAKPYQVKQIRNLIKKYNLEVGE